MRNHFRPCRDHEGLQHQRAGHLLQGLRPGALPPALAQEGHRKASATRKGLCGATPEIIAARKEATDYKLKDTEKLLEIAPYFNVPTTEVIDGVERQRDIYEIVVKVGETALSQWGQQEGEILYVKRIVKFATDNYPNRKSEPMVSNAKEKMVVGFSAEASATYLGSTFRGSYVPF